MTKTNKTLLCVLLAMVLTFALALTALTTTAQTATAEGETAVKTITFPDDNKANNKESGYSNEWTAKIGSDSWTITNFNNNSWNNSWTYIKCGTSSAIVASIATDAPIAEAIEKVVLTIDKVTANNVNSIKLTVASDKDFTTDTQTIAISAVATGGQTFTIANPIENGYYKIVFDCAKGSNGIVQISKVQYFGATTPSCDHSADKFTKTEAKDATCTEEGNVEYYTCTCGKIFADASATTELTETAIAPLGHTYGEWVFDNVAHTATRECSVCQETDTKTNTAVAFNVNGETAKGDPRSAVVEIANDILTVTVPSNAVYQGEAVTVKFETMEATFDHANYTVTVEGGTLDWGGSTDTATIMVGATALEVNITVVYNCPHTNKTYIHNDGTDTHKVVCSDCDATVAESEACVPGEDWQSDGANHWHVCTLCQGETNKAAHSYADGTCVCGKVKPEEVNYTRVENVSELKDGDKIIIVSNEKTLGVAQENNYSEASVIINADGTISISPDVAYIEITVGVSGNYFTLHTADGYLYAASSSKNYLKAQSTVNDNATWEIVIGSDGTATIKAQGTNTRNIIQYNSSSKIFSCYGSGQQDVSIYKVASPSCDHAKATLVAEVPATTETAGTKEHYTCPDCGKQLVKNGETYTEVNAQDLVIEPLVIVEVTEKITAGDGKAKFDAEANKIYLANGGKLVVTYEISQNSGVNALMFTLHYNKDLFKVESIVANTELGEAIVVTGDEVQTDVYKVLLEGLGEVYDEKYTGLLVTVTYVYVGNLTSFEGEDTAFGLDDMEAHKSNTEGSTSPVETKAVLSDVAYDVIKQASITLNDKAADSQIEVTYNAKELTVDLALNNPTLVVKSESTGKLVCKWYSDAARENEIAAPTSVGTYYLTVTIEATPAYEQSTANFTIVINPYQIDYDALSVSANPNDKALVGGTATWAESDIVVGGLAGLPDATGVYTITYGTLSFTTVGEKEISVIVTITNANYKFVSASEFATGDSETVYNGKATVSVSAKAISLVLPTLADKYYDGVAISLTGIAASVEGESLTVSVEVSVNGTVLTSEQLANHIVNAGTYNIAVRAWVEGNDNYKQVTGNLSVEIKKLTLFIDASKIVYNGSVVSWEAVTKAYKANDTELVDIAALGVSVTYQVTNGEGHDYDGSTSFDANTLATVAQLTLKAIPDDTTNFNVGSQGLKMVYQVLFAASTEPAVEESKVNVFEGEVVSAPSVSVEGYRFDAWYNGEEAYNFATPVETNLTLVAKWVKQITITWYNEDGTSVLKTATKDVGTVVKFEGEKPTKAATDYIDYAFDKWVDTTDATYDLENEFTLTADISVKATFKGTVARMSVSYKVVDGKGNAGAEVDLGIKTVGTNLSDLGLPELTNYKWHKVSAWMNGETEFTTVVADDLNGAHTIVLVATYTFNIGLGDVDGNGNVNTDDIVLYRKHIVGGYDITVVDDAWTTATAEGFDENKVYFLAQVANVDDDASNTNDVRDVSTIRMALVGGYGYAVKDGKEVVKGSATTQSAKVQYKQVLAPMGLFGKKFAL